MYPALAPLCATRNALHPAGTPVGPITKAWPKRSVRMLGSPALLLPWSNRLGLNIGLVGALAASAGPEIANGKAPRETPATRISVDPTASANCGRPIDDAPLLSPTKRTDLLISTLAQQMESMAGLTREPIKLSR